MDDAHALLSQALSALMNASDDVFCAADMLSDAQAEYHGDRGLGVPPRNKRIEAIYDLSQAIAEIAEQLAPVIDEMEA